MTPDAPEVQAERAVRALETIAEQLQELNRRDGRRTALFGGRQ